MIPACPACRAPRARWCEPSLTFAKEIAIDTRRVLAYHSLLFCLAGSLPAAAADRLLRDPGFESVPAGELAATGIRDGWEVQQTGRPAVRPRLQVECIEDLQRAKSGAKCLALSIPRDTVGFEFVTVGQRVRLAAGQEYEAAVWVRWPDGPEDPPAGAHSTSGHPSAIVSFWARHRDGKGDFAGRDEWLFDRRWHRLSFRFCTTDPEQPTLVYVSLLPNQQPADTTLLLDDLTLNGRDATVASDPRAGSIALDSDFSQQAIGSIGPPWGFRHLGGTGIAGEAADSGGQRFLRLAMGESTSNFESAQVWQHVDLRAGARYEVSCRMRWDNFAPGKPAPIVNYGIYHVESRTWYGPVDQVLERTGEWRTYRFAHCPPCAGTWKLYVQLNGWGNFGRAVTVSCDDFQIAVPAR